MAKVSFYNVDEIEAQTQGNGGPGSNVGFFTLRNDNDEAVVRFMCNSPEDFEILTVHDVQLGSKYRKVNCIRDPREPLDNCPLCKSGARINNRFFIKMLQYDKVTDPTTGAVRVVPKAVIWERSTAYAKTLKSYLDNYGPLSDIICKIIRHGRAGDMQTTYEIVPNLNKAVYRDEIYVNDPSLFGDFEAFGTIVMDRTADEMNHYLATGEFPARQRADSSSPSAPAAPVAPTAAPGALPGAAVMAPTQSQYVAPTAYANPPATNMTQYATVPASGSAPGGVVPGAVNPAASPVGQRMPWESTTTPAGFERPRRY